MPINPLKQLLALAAEECDQTAVRSQAIGARHELEAQKAGCDMTPYLAAKAANNRLVPKSKASTREKAVKEFAAEKRLLAKFLVDLRTKEKEACKIAEQQVDENAAQMVETTHEAIDHGVEVDKCVENAASIALALGQELVAIRAARANQSVALDATKTTAMQQKNLLAKERKLAAACVATQLDDLASEVGELGGADAAPAAGVQLPAPAVAAEVQPLAPASAALAPPAAEVQPPSATGCPRVCIGCSFCLAGCCAS